MDVSPFIILGRVYLFLVNQGSRRKIIEYRNRIIFLEDHHFTAIEIAAVKELLDEEQFFVDTGIRTNSDRIAGFKYLKKKCNIEKWSTVRKIKKYIVWENIEQPEFTLFDQKFIAFTEKVSLRVMLLFLASFIGFIIVYQLIDLEKYISWSWISFFILFIFLFPFFSIGLKSKYVDPFKLVEQIIKEKREYRFNQRS